MSDTFDHMTDAYESLDWNYGDSEEGGFYGRRRSTFYYDPLYYHTLMQFVDIIAETDKAILFDINDHNGDYKVWIPKSLIRSFDKENKTMYVHSKSIPILRRVE